MKRAGCLFEQVTDFEKLRSSARRAAKGKVLTGRAAEFLFDLEAQVIVLQNELVSGRYTPRPYFTFTVSEPKPRNISAAHFRDRVVHHALCSAMEPMLEKYAVADSFACRKGKGSHAAIAIAEKFTRRHSYYLKLDIKKFFETCDHKVIKHLFRRLFKDKQLLALADLFIDAGAPGSLPGKGIPIGNLTSQHFANLYLGPLDHYIKECCGVRGYCRYMDDMLLFSNDKEELRHWHDKIQAYVNDKLLLTIKARVTVLAPVTEGVLFLGFRIWPQMTRLDRYRKKRLGRSLRTLQKKLDHSFIDEETAVRSGQSLLGWSQKAATTALRRSFRES